MFAFINRWGGLDRAITGFLDLINFHFGCINITRWISNVTKDLIVTSKFPRMTEAFLELVAKLFGIYMVYLGFNCFVSAALGQNLASDTLLSILLLPALYILKDINTVIDPLTVSVELCSDRVSVTRGLNPKVKDTLEFKNVENTEIITTLMGRFCGYSTIRLYSPGGLVEIPHAYEAENIIDSINSTQKTLK